MPKAPATGKKATTSSTKAAPKAATKAAPTKAGAKAPAKAPAKAAAKAASAPAAKKATGTAKTVEKKAAATAKTVEKKATATAKTVEKKAAATVKKVAGKATAAVKAVEKKAAEKAPAKTAARTAAKAPTKAAAKAPAKSTEKPAAKAPAKKTEAAAPKAAPKPAAPEPKGKKFSDEVVAKTTFTPKPMSKAAIAKDPFLSRQQQLLEIERTEYMAQAEALKAEAEQMAAEMEPGDTQFDEESGEGGTANIDREHNLRLVAVAMSSVEEIDRALAKMERGTYGVCENCGQKIAEARLEALPFAALCVQCKSGGLTRR